jgi:superfamily I DNA and/or RNA helicase
VLRPRRATDDDAETARAVVARRSARRLTVAFEGPLPAFVSTSRLVADRLPSDVTWERARRAIDQVEAAPRVDVRPREVLLGLSPARFSPAQPASISWSRPLNAEQIDAIGKAMTADDLFLVHGPPGTGKSHVLAEVVVQEVRRGRRVLASAASNAAVDHLLSLFVAAGLSPLRLGHPARVAEALYPHTLDARVEEHEHRRLARELLDEAWDLLGYARRQRDRGRSRERFANAREAQGEANRLFAEARRLERAAVAAILGEARVVCATLTGVAGAELAGERFDLAVVDEATQAIEPIALIGWLKAPRLVLAGDHRQLGPTILSKEAAAGGLGRSLFERLLEGGAPALMLREQYRMNMGIIAFPSEEMYGGGLRAHPTVAARTLADLLEHGRSCDAPPVVFVDTAGKGFDDHIPEGSESHDNSGEASLIVARVLELCAAGLAPADIAVIAPYAAQVALLRAEIEAAAPDVASALEVDTVDAFQGREKEAVLVSLTRSNLAGEIGFLGDLRRMNVAMTRPRRHLFVVGDSATLARHPFYERFIARAQAEGGYRSAWEWPSTEP